MNALKYFFPLLVLTGSLMLVGCDNNSKEEKKTENSSTGHQIVKLTKKSVADIGLTYFTVQTKPLTGTLTAPAKVLPNQDLESQVGSLVQGRVHQIFVKVGDYVTTEQALMTVEGLDVGAIKAGFLKAKASYDYAKSNYERQKKLFDDKIGSQKALLESQAEYDKAFAEYNAEDKRIHSVGLADEDVIMGKNGQEHTSGTLPIKSHINGIVVERNVIVGQYIDATTTAFKVINTNSVWIDGQIYEKDLAKVQQKTTAVFATASYPGVPFTGRVIYIGQTLDEQSRTITVRGEFNNPNNRLKLNMFGELKIPIGTNTNAMLIPDEAVVKDAGEQYVFVRTNDTTFEKRTVITGTSVDSMIEIKNGLKESDWVVSKGVFYLKSDLKKEELTGE
jgi:cobalt-zinc-cadmium efflux system membrane fusion protein